MEIVGRLKPKALQKGDSIGISAPSSPFNRETFMKGVEILKGWGFEIRFTERIFLKELFFAGGETDRLNELGSLFLDPEVKAILIARGGYGVTPLMRNLPIQTLASSNKIFAGMSDLTPLLNLFSQRFAIPTLHSPFVTSLASLIDEESLESFIRVLSDPKFIPELRVKEGGIEIKSGRAEGESCGGNLSLIVSTLKTPYEIETDGKVLFMEEIDEKAYRVHRMLIHLRDAGKLSNPKAIVLGDFIAKEEGGEGVMMDAIEDVLKDLEIPVLSGLPFGHFASNHSFPIGLECIVDTGEGVVRWKEPFTV